jgi:hypothetical protein
MFIELFHLFLKENLMHSIDVLAEYGLLEKKNLRTLNGKSLKEKI